MRSPRASRHRKARAVTIVALVAFVLVDAALAVVAWRFLQRRAAAGGAAANRPAQWSQSLLASEPDGAALLTALVQQQARRDRKLNLSVSVQGGIMHLQREGAPLRRMRVVPGPEATVEAGVRIARPRGRRRLLRVVDEEFVWSVPRWVFAHRGLEPPPAAAREVRGGLGSLALILEDGTLIYSRPAHGPLSTDSYVMPGALRAELSDLEAIRASLSPGMPVYFH
jgi:hypothetical protein